MRKPTDPLKIAFICAEKNREFQLCDAFLLGAKRAGDQVGRIQKSQFKPDQLDYDVYGLVGVKSLRLFRLLREAGKDVVFFDKGYFRHRGPNRTWEYWRVAVNTHHPTDYVEEATHGPERWLAISKRRCIEVRPWRTYGEHVIYAGSSEKYHAFCRLKDPTTYAKAVIKELNIKTNRLVVYRPKPTWEEAEPIKGSSFSPPTEGIYAVLQNAWCLVTNGSNAAFEAVIEGIPCIVLGEGIARPISSQSLDDVENPRLASEAEKLQWFSNIAWCMFTEEEMKDGLAWQAIRPQFFGEYLDDSGLDEIAGVAMKPSKALLKKSGQWKKPWKKSRTKAEQRKLKPFTKTRPVETPDEPIF